MSTKLWIWKQGPFYPHLGKKIIELPYPVKPGPSDSQVVISGHHVQPDSNGNFLDGEYSNDEQDAIHTYGIVRMVIDLYEKLLGKRIDWPWNTAGTDMPLKVLINSDGTNCRYIAEDGTILLDKYGFESNRIHNCRSVDLVCHETAHAIIHTLKPEWRNGNPETRGVVEAFCDLTATFWILSQKDMCAEVIKENNGDLRKSSMLSLFGVGHGYEGNKYREIRDAINHKDFKAEHWDVYHHCQTLVRWLYNTLVKESHNPFWNLSKDNDLYTLGKNWVQVIIKTLLELADVNPTIMEFYSLFLKDWNGILEKTKKHFKT